MTHVHVWPPELSPDAACSLCGLTYDACAESTARDVAGHEWGVPPTSCLGCGVAFHDSASMYPCTPEGDSLTWPH